MPTKRSSLPAAPDLDALKHDPVAFIRTVLKRPDGQPAEPHAAQELLFRHIRRITVVPWGRQSGKSTGFGWYGAWYAATKSHKKVWVIAPTLDQARIIFNEIAYHYRTSLKSLVKGKVVEYPFPKIVLKNGSEIHARGANSPQYIRGKNGHLILCDEAAFFKDKTLTDVIEPMLTVTGKDPDAALVLTSTPFGEGAFKQFFDAATAAAPADPDYTGPGSWGCSEESAWFQFPSAVNPHADQKFLARVKARYGEDSLLWRTEYLAEFADDDLQVIPWKHIRWAYENFPGYETDDPGGSSQVFPIPPKPGHRYVQGDDLANRSDYFVSVVLDTFDPERVIFSEMTRYRGRGYAAIKASIKEVHHRFYEARTLVDATSLGESVVEDLNLQGVPAEGYKFTNQSKHEIVQELGRLFAEHRIVIPYQQDIISELRYFAYDITPAGVVRMEAKRGHDDIVMAMALAAHLALLPHEIGWFTPVEALDTLGGTFGAPHTTSAHPSQQVPYGVVNLPWTSLRRAGTSAQPPRLQPDTSPQGYDDPFAHLNDDD